MVYDTLLATDSNFKIQPQMADWKVSDDKLTYTFTLRDGLKWHDGTPVTAEDCVASLKRWGKADSMGQKLMDFTASLEATDAKTITLKLKEPYGLVLESIGKPSSLVPFMMPKRLAETPPASRFTEQIGSGPFKFVQAEFQPGVKAVYREEQGLCAAQGAAELDRGRQGGEGRSRRMDHDVGRADRGQRAAVRRYRFHGSAAVRHAAGAGGRQGSQGRDPQQARLPDARPHEFPAAAVRQRQNPPRGLPGDEPEGRAGRAGRQSQILQDLRRLLHLRHAAGDRYRLGDAGEGQRHGGGKEAARRIRL